jgi:hypothetical protein
VDWLCEYRSVRVGRRCFVSVFFLGGLLDFGFCFADDG